MSEPLNCSPVPHSLSEKLRACSFLCAALLIFTHTSTLFALHPGLTPAVAWIETVTAWEFCPVIVPIFFSISGFLLATHWKGTLREGYPVILKKRARSLLLPYFLWSVLFALTVFPYNTLGNYLAHRELTSGTYLTEPLVSAGNLFRFFGLDLFTYPFDIPLWFIRNLLLLIACSPLLIPVMRKKAAGWILLAVFSVLFLFHAWTPMPWYRFFEIGFSLSGLLFFSLGLKLAFHPIEWNCRKITLAALFIVTLLLAVWGTSLRLRGGLNQWPDYLTGKLVWITGLPLFWLAFDLIPASWKTRLAANGQYAFFLYAAHIGVLRCLFGFRIEQKLLPYLGGSFLLLHLIRFAVTLGATLAAAKLAQRFLPSVYRLFTGGR